MCPEYWKHNHFRISVVWLPSAHPSWCTAWLSIWGDAYEECPLQSHICRGFSVQWVNAEVNSEVVTAHRKSQFTKKHYFLKVLICISLFLYLKSEICFCKRLCLLFLFLKLWNYKREHKASGMSNKTKWLLSFSSLVSMSCDHFFSMVGICHGFSHSFFSLRRINSIPCIIHWFSKTKSSISEFAAYIIFYFYF